MVHKILQLDSKQELKVDLIMQEQNCSLQLD